MYLGNCVHRINCCFDYGGQGLTEGNALQGHPSGTLWGPSTCKLPFLHGCPRNRTANRYKSP